MLNDVKVIAFDIDGTLYPQIRFNVRIFFHLITHLKFYYNFWMVRKALRRCAPLPDLYKYQAVLLSERLHCTTPEAAECLQKNVYGRYPSIFKKVKPYKDVEETFKRIKEAGYKIAILSDFPPEQKGDVWGLTKYCDGVFGAEIIGALKPSKYPFGVMAHELGVPLQNILYVGNNKKCDVYGAKYANMKTAYLLPWWRKILHMPLKEADICFKNYRQLMEIVLK